MERRWEGLLHICHHQVLTAAECHCLMTAVSHLRNAVNPSIEEGAFNEEV